MVASGGRLPSSAWCRRAEDVRDLVVAAISLWNYDMRIPVKGIALHGPGDVSPYRCTTPRFGGTATSPNRWAKARAPSTTLLC